MAITKPRPEKVAVVDEVRERLSSASATLLTEYRGLKVDELAELRAAVRAAGGEYKIYKNTLVRLAVADLGLEGLDDLLVGPTAVTFVDGDAVLVAKALKEFSRTAPNLVVKGGVLGRTALTAADAGALADIAPRDVVLAQLAGALAAPLQKFAGLLGALPRNLAYGIAALIDKGGAPGAPASEPAPAPEAEAAEPAEAPEPEADAAAAGEEPEAPASAPEGDAPEAIVPAPPDEAPEAVVPVEAAENAEAPVPPAPAAAGGAATPDQPTPESPDGTDLADKEQ